MRLLLCVVLLACPLAPAFADDEPTPAERAAEIAKAVDAKHRTALEKFAEARDPDSWRVVEALCRAGKREAAQTFAKLVSGKDGAKLPGYAKDWTPSKAADKALDELADLSDPAKRLAHLAKVPEALESVPGLRVLHERGKALRAARRMDDARATFERLEQAARALGWLRQASTALHERGLCHALVADYDAALEVWEARLTLDRERGDEAGIAGTLGNLGGAYHRAGNDMKAAALQRESIAIAKRIGAKERLAIGHFSLAAALSALGRNPEALEENKRAVEVAKAIGDESIVGSATQAIGAIYQELGEFKQALALQQEALAIAEKNEDAGGQAVALGNLGSTYEEMDYFKEAEKAFARSAALLEEQRDIHNLALLFINWGRLLRKLGRADEAVEKLERAAGIAQRIRNGNQIAEALLELGNAQAAAGNTERADQAHNLALQLRQRLNDPKGIVRVYGSAGTVYAELGQVRTAKQRFEKAVQIAEKLGDELAVATWLNNLAHTERMLAEFDAAVANQERALATFQKLGRRANAVSARNQLATILTARGSYARALSLLEQCVAEARELKDPRLEAIALGNLGAAQEAVSSFDEALGSYRGALALLEARGDVVRAAAVQGNVGNVLAMQGAHDEALVAMKKAYDREIELGLEVTAAKTLGNIGNLYSEMGRTDDALEALGESIAAMEKAERPRDVALSLTNLAELQRAMGDAGEALKTAERALSIADELVLPDLQASLWRTITHLHDAAGRHAEAVAAAREGVEAQNQLLRGLSEAEGARARAEQGSIYDSGLLAAMHANDVASASWFLESGRAGTLLESMEARRTVEMTMLPDELRKAQDDARTREAAAVGAYRAAARRGRLRETREARKRVEEARAAAKRISTRIQREAKAAADWLYPAAASLKDIQASLAEDEALILYGLFEPDAVALVTTRTRSDLIRVGKTTSIDAAVEALALGDAGGDFSKPLALLEKAVFGRLQLAKSIRRVLIAPDGSLSTVPFALLAAGREVAYVPSGTAYLRLRSGRAKPGEGVLALGDPIYGRGRQGTTRGSRGSRGLVLKLSALPATRAEAIAVGTTTLLGKDATEPRLVTALKAAPQGRWRAVHLACHGLIDSRDPLDSALALTADADTDGFLTVRDLLTVEVPADLVVLSACETARGKLVKREGILGLTRAFMVAGAPCIVASLWKVDDEATQALMTKFYEIWNPKGGKGPGAAAALKQAQAFVRAQPKWKHPYYWAAWVLWGLPD